MGKKLLPPAPLLERESNPHHAAQFGQLWQLRRLEPATAMLAEVWMDKLPAFAAKLIREGMQAALTRLIADREAKAERRLGPVIFDLVIASRKYGFGSTSHGDAPILWWKVAGQPKQQPPRACDLTVGVIMERLMGYDLVDTEVQVNQVIRKYRRTPSPSGCSTLGSLPRIGGKKGRA